MSSRGLARRLWAFGNCRFNEATWTLTVDDKIVDIEGKPLELLIELLRHAGEVVTKDELLEAAWPSVLVGEGSLTTAISKLRRTIGDEDGRVIVTVPRIGYRLSTPVITKPIASEQAPALAIEPGTAVPGRPHWLYAERLGLSAHAEVWRIEHAKTHAQHVLKLAVEAGQLKALKREVAIGRLLREALGERPDLLPPLDWNFTSAPYSLECDYGGANLIAWAEAQGGLAAVPLALRLELLAVVATSVAAAHGVGVLHKDLKPSNILVAVDRNGRWQAKVVDFGSASLSDPARLGVLNITQTGFDVETDGRSSQGGTTLWMAPELLAGRAPSTSSDLYALGVTLYQLVVGDLHRPLAPGWEDDIADPLLREDIAAAAAGDPDRRMDGPAELARRLRSLDERRQEQEAEESARRQALLAEERLARLRARRPWVAAVAAALVFGTVASTTLFVRAAHDRDEALRQTRIADAANQFLASDLLARSNPFHSGSATESLVDAVKQASPLIDRRFADEPAVAARLHQTIAAALDRRSDWTGARDEYAKSEALWSKLGAAGQQDALVLRLQRAMLEARSNLPGSLDRAKALIAGAMADIGKLRAPRPELAVWTASAAGMVALMSNDAGEAKQQFATALQAASDVPSLDVWSRLNLRQRLAFATMRGGDAAAAERQFRALVQDFTAIEGPDGPNALMTRMNVAQTLMTEGHHEEVVRETNTLYPLMASKLGPDNEMTLQVVTTRAQSEGILERWDDAVRDDTAVHMVALRTQGARSFFGVATLVDLATAKCRGGHIAEGLQNADEGYRNAVAGFGERAGLTGAAAYTLAECDLALGRFDEAAKMLEGIDRAAVSQLAADPDWGANVDLALARIALAKGDKAEARKRLEAARAPLSAAKAEPYQVRQWRKAMAALA